MQIHSGNLPFQVSISSRQGCSPQLLASGDLLGGDPVELCAFAQGAERLYPRAIVQTTHDQYELDFPTGEGDLRAVLHMQKGESTLTWRLAVQTGGKGAPSVYFPFLARLSLGESSRWVDLFSQNSQQGKPILRRRNADAPLLITDGTRSLIVLQSGELVEKAYAPDRLVGAPGLAVPLHSAVEEVYQGTLQFIETGGWRTAFAAIRTHLRSRVDLSEYQREDLQWYSDQFVQHFTFLYGREILDLEKGEFNLDRFLADGERDFGGFDGFLIWAVYPRIGVDERTQWEFYDDLPGGREGLKQMSRKAREKGVRFFVPYKPWDRSAERHGLPRQPHEEQLAQLIEDTEADGVFLDTMDLITPEFRQAIDRRKPGVVFCSEGRTQGKALDIITGCWDQSGNREFANWSAGPEIMPLVDLWRFVLPEHRLFVISRHTMGDDRIRITQRGFFNGMGWVIWQDIFGLTLPYTPAEAALVKKCRTIFRENKIAVNTSAPTPLVETLVNGVLANEFPAETKRMWTFFNENDHEIDGEVLQVERRKDTHFVDVWNEREVYLSERSRLITRLEPRQVGCVVEYPSLIDVSETEIRVREPKAGLQLSIQHGPKTLTYPAAGPEWIPAPADMGKVVVKLLDGQEVLDQVFIAGEQ